MSLGKRVGVVVLGILLTTTLSGGVVVATGHQTVLVPEFVSTSLADAGAYEIVTDAMVAQMGNLSERDPSTAEGESAAMGPTDGAGSLPGMDGLGPSIIAEAVTESYVRTQTEANIDRLYAYLHGNTDELNLSVETTSLKENAVAAVESRIANISTKTLLGSVAGDLDTGDLPAETAEIVDPGVIATMADNRSSYRAAQDAIRTNAREQVVDELVTQTYESSTADQKLALVIPDYDPTEYTEAEKSALVREHEDDIRSEIRQRVETERGEEIDETVDSQLSSLADQTTKPEDPDANVTAATLTFQAAILDGLAGDLTYNEFQTETAEAKSSLAAAVAEQAKQSLDEEIPDRVTVTDQFGSPSDFRRARQVVGILDLAAIVLPLLAVVLIGLLYLVSRSPVTTIRTTGSSFLFAGLPLFLGTTWAKGNLRSLLPTVPEESDVLMSLVMSLLDRILGVAGAYSLVLVMVGIVLIGVSVAHARGVFDDIR